jgi:hypothetical protein
VYKPHKSHPYHRSPPLFSFSLLLPPLSASHLSTRSSLRRHRRAHFSRLLPPHSSRYDDFFYFRTHSHHAAAPFPCSSSPLSSAAQLPSSAVHVMQSLVVYRHAPRSCRQSFALRAQRRHCRSPAPRWSQPIVSLTYSLARTRRDSGGSCVAVDRDEFSRSACRTGQSSQGASRMQRHSSSASLDSNDHPALAALHRATQTTARLLCRHRTPLAAYTPSQNGVCKRALSHGSRGIIAASLASSTARSRQSTPLPSRTLAAPSLGDCRRLSRAQYRYRRSFALSRSYAHFSVTVTALVG